MHRINCAVQLYGWGKPGAVSKVAAYKAAQQADFQIDQSKNYAELWMGTHSNGPSQLVSGPTLSDYLKQNGAKVLGEKISQHFYQQSELKPGDLPFLFKVLSINQALSIQAHPTKEHARLLHAKDPKNYPDPNHKPEMIIAISETFEGMCDFRPAKELAEHFESVGELRVLCGQENCDRFIQDYKNKSSDLQTSLKAAFSSMMNASGDLLNAQFSSLLARLQAIEASKRTYLDSLFIRLAQTYPNDIGCFAIYLLNCIQLKKGEAIFLAANVPHAYLLGDGVECMACSDNVVRAGLTPKFKDVQVLCSMLDYTMRSSEESKLRTVKTSNSDKPYLDEFRPTVDEFSVQQIRVRKSDFGAQKQLLIPKSESGSIIIVIENSLGAKSHLSVEGGASQAASVGLVYYVDAGTDSYLSVDGDVSGEQDAVVFLAYRAYCDIKSN